MVKEVDEDDNEDRESDNEQEEQEAEPEPDEKSVKRIKKVKALIREWIETDRAIKEYTLKMKKHKDAKKETEEKILVLIEKTGLEEHKFTMKQDDGVHRIYRAKSTSKGGYREDIIRESMMVVLEKKRL